MHHHTHATGTSAADIERAMDQLAKIIAARKDGRRLLPLYARLEQELATIRAADDTMSAVLARLSRITG